MNPTATLLTLRIPSFEAAIRKAADRRLAARPVVVVTSLKPLGRVIAVCPEARAAGVAEEMHFPTARIRCPDAAFCLPDRRLNDQVMRTLLFRAGKYSPLVEPAGGGRVVLDTRGTEKLWGDNHAVAERLRRDVRAGLHLPAAAGLAVCRPWSLLASRAAGDDGVCHVPPGGEGEFLDRTPVDWVDGLTPNARALLLEMNIRSLGQLRAFDRHDLRLQFGRDCGDALWTVVHPQPWDAVAVLSEQTVLEMEANRVRIEAALSEASAEEDKLRLVARTLAARIAATLRAKGVGAARLRLTLLHADGALKTAEAKTGGYVQEEEALQAAAARLLARVFVRRVRAIRLWMEAEKLAEPARQGVLFQPEDAGAGLRQLPAARRLEAERLLAAVDGIKARFGDGALCSAALLGAKRDAPRARQLALAMGNASSSA